MEGDRKKPHNVHPLKIDIEPEKVIVWKVSFLFSCVFSGSISRFLSVESLQKESLVENNMFQSHYSFEVVGWYFKDFV